MGRARAKHPSRTSCRAMTSSIRSYVAMLVATAWSPGRIPSNRAGVRQRRCFARSVARRSTVVMRAARKSRQWYETIVPVLLQAIDRRHSFVTDLRSPRAAPGSGEVTHAVGVDRSSLPTAGPGRRHGKHDAGALRVEQSGGHFTCTLEYNRFCMVPQS